jgi:hypothetical protein
MLHSHTMDYSSSWRNWEIIGFENTMMSCDAPEAGWLHYVFTLFPSQNSAFLDPYTENWKYSSKSFSPAGCGPVQSGSRPCFAWGGPVQTWPGRWTGLLILLQLIYSTSPSLMQEWNSTHRCCTSSSLDQNPGNVLISYSQERHIDKAQLITFFMSRLWDG